MKTETLLLREAKEDDLPLLVAMLADDPLGARRERNETPLPPAYREAFAAIEKDPNNELLVADIDGECAGMLQLTYLPGLTYCGSWRALIEGVRIAGTRRNQGIGRRMIEAAIERARARHCHVIQLTTDKQRPDAARFYESLGFKATHEGMKRFLDRLRD